nr:hypothetical protein [Clostridia bacterium]
MSKILIGWSEKDISTDKPIDIPGQFHKRISRGIMDPLTVTALVIRDGENSAVFLSCDMLTVKCGLYDEVMAKTALLNPEIPSEKILMSVTHTHTGASHYFDGLAHFSDPNSKKAEPAVKSDSSVTASTDEYRDFLSTSCAEAISEAWMRADDGGVAWGYGYAVVAHSRRPVFSDGGTDTHSVMYGKTDDPSFLGYESGADHFVNLLYTFDASDRLTGAIINIPCPSQCSEHEYRLSADYWHNVRSELRRRHGDHIKVIAQYAAGGDLSPRILHYKTAQQRRMMLKYGITSYGSTEKALTERADIAERITNAFDEVLSWAKKDIRHSAVVRHEVHEFHLSRRMPTEAEYAESKAELERLGEFVPKTDGTPEQNLDADSKQLTLRARHERVVSRYENNDTSKLPMKAHIIRIGDIAFASNRFELYINYQHRIQARSPFEQTFIVQLAAVPGNDGGTYLPTGIGVRNKGYTANIFDNLCSPEGGDELVEQTLEVLNKIHED